MNKALCLTVLLALAPLGACSRPEGPLAGARIGGPFTLTDQDGKRVSDRDFAGRYRLIYFGYTFCPDVCPVDLQKLMAGYRLFAQADAGRAAKVQPIFVSVDPGRDTPAVLKQYVAAFDPHLIGLTGTPDEIAAVAKEYAVSYAKEPPANGAAKGAYIVQHTRLATLFGPDGQPIALVRQDGAPADVAADLAQWVR